MLESETVLSNVKQKFIEAFEGLVQFLVILNLEIILPLFYGVSSFYLFVYQEAIELLIFMRLLTIKTKGETKNY